MEMEVRRGTTALRPAPRTPSQQSARAGEDRAPPGECLAVGAARALSGETGRLLGLGDLLEAEGRGAAALLLAAVNGTQGEAGVALAANLAVDVGLLGKLGKGRGHDTTAEAEDEVKGGLLLDVVVREGAAIIELLALEDETLLVRGDALLVLDLLLDGLDGVRVVDIKSDGLVREGLHENLHRHVAGLRSGNKETQQ